MQNKNQYNVNDLLLSCLTLLHILVANGRNRILEKKVIGADSLFYYDVEKTIKYNLKKDCNGFVQAKDAASEQLLTAQSMTVVMDIVKRGQTRSTL